MVSGLIYDAIKFVLKKGIIAIKKEICIIGLGVCGDIVYWLHVVDKYYPRPPTIQRTSTKSSFLITNLYSSKLFAIRPNVSSLFFCIISFNNFQSDNDRISLSCVHIIEYKFSSNLSHFSS